PWPAGVPCGVLPIWVCRSSDGGRTWSRADGVELPTKSRLAAAGTLTLSDRIVPFGDIIEIGAGKLGVCLYAWHPETKTHASYFFTSADDGGTWSIAGIIGPDGLNETTPLRLAGGELIACARTHWDGQPNQEQRLELFRSTDNGATWQRERPVTMPNEHPAHLLQLADGRILLTYGDRNAPNGIEVRLSDDGGRTWSPPERIAGFEGDGGYPATVELADGRMLTASYAERSALRSGYHMDTVTWRLPPKK
ncbi:MAG: sialidase family protein, partial [Planctomycetia bacterium]